RLCARCRGTGQGVDIDARQVRRTGAVGIRRGDDELDGDRAPAAGHADFRGRNGNPDQWRQRWTLFPATGCRDRHGDDRYGARANHRMYRERSSFFTMSASIRETYASSMMTRLSAKSGPSNDTLSSSFSMTVWSRRAPIFSVRSLTMVAKSAIRQMASSVNTRSMPSVSMNAVYCLTSALRGWVSMRT